MKPLIPQKITAVSIMALALAVSGCGGGSSKTAAVEPDPTPTPIECPAGQEPNAANEACVDTAETTAAKAAAATKAADTKRTAINAEADVAVADDDGPGGADATTDHAIAITRDSDDPAEVKITVAGARTTAPKFDSTDLGHGSTMHERVMPADSDGDVVREIMVVTTDIKAPTATPFAMVMGQALNARDLDDAVDADEDGTATNDFTALTVAGNGADDAAIAVRMLVMSDSFASGSGASTTHTFDYEQADGDDTTLGAQPVEAAEVDGTYNGADGTYLCASTSADCTVTVNAKGEVTGMSDGWVFIPGEDATSDVADADFLHYGFWLKNTTDKDGVVTYNEVETFATASVAASGNVAAVTGKGTYSGGATGVYVRDSLGEDGTVMHSTSGRFTADASLTAYFSQTVDDTDTTGVDESGQLRPADLNTVTGTIDSFRLSGGESNAWSVALKGDIDTAEGTASGTANGGGVERMFNATFHGPTADDTQPSSVVGEFNASFSNGTVAGGFGATRDKE